MKIRSVTQASLDTGDAGSTQDFTVSGFGTPRAWVVTVCLPSSEDSLTDEGTLGIGFAETGDNVSFTRYWSGVWVEDDTSGIFGGRSNSTAELQALSIGSTTSNEIQGTGATITDGIRITYTTKPATSLMVRVDLIDCDEAEVDSQSSTTSTASVALNFRPDAGIIIHNATIGSGGLQGYRPCIGFVAEDGDSNITQCSIATHSGSNSPTTNIAQRVDSTHAISRLVAPSYTASTWTIDSFDSGPDGYTYTRDAGSNTMGFGALWIQDSGTEFHCEAVTTPTSTGPQSYTGAGFGADGGWVAATHMDQVNTADSSGDNGTFGFGSWDQEDQSCSVISTEDGAVGTSNSASIVSSSGLEAVDDAGAASIEGTVSSVVGGYAVNYSSVDGTARYFLALVFSGEPVYSAVEEDLDLTEQAVAAAFGPAVNEDVDLTEEVGEYLVTVTVVPPSMDMSTGQGSYAGVQRGQIAYARVESGQGI